MAFKMKGSAFKLNNVATKSALKQTKSPLEQAVAESTASNSGVRNADIAAAMETDNALLERFKTEQPEIYAKMMKKYEREVGGGTTSLGTGQQGSSTHSIQPYPIETATGIDFIDNYTSGGRKRLRNEKSNEVNTKLLNYIKSNMGVKGGLSEE
jgi:hypothetical protein